MIAQRHDIVRLRRGAVRTMHASAIGGGAPAAIGAGVGVGVMVVALLCPGVALAQAPTTAAADRASAPAAIDVYRAQQAMVHRAVAAIAPSVVTIETIGGAAPRPVRPRPTTRPTGPRRPREPGPPTPPDPGGSFLVADGPTTGLVYSADGMILTSSFNFARDPAVITVRLPDGRRLPAKLLASDEIRRLSLIKIDATGLPVPRWADEPDIRVGQTVVALGRGFGGDDVSVTVGIVSGLNRMAGNAIQTDAALSPANYGGPLVDLRGHVVGLSVPMSYSPGDLAGVELYDSGIGFAIPAWRAEPAALRLAKGAGIRRGVLGVRLDPRGGRRGVRVIEVADPSPAHDAGIEAGDLLVAVDDRPVRNLMDVQRSIGLRAAGEPVALTIRRGIQRRLTDAVLAPIDKVGTFAPTEDEEPAPDEDGSGPPGP